MNRFDFPAITAFPGVYLDTAATAHKPALVIQAMSDWYTRDYASVHRGFYAYAERATTRYEQIRSEVAQWISAQDSSEVVFTRGATESINMIVHCWARAIIAPGDEIVITALEHHANQLPWEALARERGLRVRSIPVYGDALQFDLSTIPSYFSEKTRLFAFCSSSNIIGAVPPAVRDTLIAAARSVGAAICIDAAQTVAHERVDVRLWDPDFMVFSGHKMYGPTGIGVLYIAGRRHTEIRPATYGGGMVVQAGIQEPVWKGMPHLLEAGTPPIGAAMGLQAAIAYLSTIDYQALQKREAMLTKQLLTGLVEIPGIRILGDQRYMQQNGSMVSFSIAGIHPHDIAHHLALHGICVRSGDHCCQRLHTALGLSGTVRASIGMYTTESDIAQCIAAVTEAYHLLRV